MAFENQKENNQPLEESLTSFDLNTLTTLLETGHEDQVADYLESFQLAELPKKERWKYYRIKIALLRIRNKKAEALKLTEQLLKIAKKSSNPYIIFEAKIIRIIIIAYFHDKIKEKNRLVEEVHELFSKIKFPDDYSFNYSVARLKLVKLFLPWINLSTTEALEIAKELIELSQKFNWLRLEARVTNISGVICSRKWKFAASIKYYEKSLELNETIGNISQIPTLLMNLAWSSRWIKDYQKAEKYCKMGLAFIDENPITKDPINIACFYHTIIRLYVDLNKEEQMNNYLSEFKKINQEDQVAIINYLFQFTLGVVLINETRMKEKVKGQEILKELIDNPIQTNLLDMVAIRSEITFSYCESLCEEIEYFGNEEALEELYQQLDELYEFTRIQKAHGLEVQCLLLESVIFIVKGDFVTAKKILEKARIHAEEQGLGHFAIKASNEYDKLAEQINKWEKMMEEKPPSFRERIDFLNFEKRFHELIDKRVETIEVEPEEPAFLLILSQKGLSYYSYKFTEVIKIDDQLIAGFITAITSFLQATFHTSDILERIKHRDFTILIKEIDHFIFCYIFKGPSYSALKKFNQFIEEIIADKQYEKLKKEEDIGKLFVDRSLFDKIAQKIFVS
jgi:tetratricopeptide (TPR) repeat protein